MIIISILSLLVLLILDACEESGDVLIPEDKMAQIILDLNISDQIIRKYPAPYRDSISHLLTESLLLIHHVDKEQLDTNLYLYQFDLQKAKSLSDKVQQYISELKKEGQ